MWDSIPLWLQFLIQGLGLFTIMTFSTIIVTRTGRNPYWALLSIFPFMLVIGVWLVASTRWPSVKASGPEQ